MNNSRLISDLLKFLLIAAALLLIFIGIQMIFQWNSVTTPTTGSATPHTDSSVIKKQNTDTANKTVTSVSETTVYRTMSMEDCSSCRTTLADGMLKKGYDFVLLGLIILLSIFILPYLSSLSFLSLFSANFKDKVEAGKAIINDAANAANTTVTTEKPQTEQVPVSSEQRDNLKNMMKTGSIDVETIQKYAVDDQKGKWGRVNEKNSRKMTASVIPVEGSKELFKITVKVISTDVEKPLQGKVVFHLHHSFPNDTPAIYVVQGEAKLELIAWGAFTVGAETDNGATRLELDLAQLLDAPLLFKSR